METQTRKERKVQICGLEDRKLQFNSYPEPLQFLL